MRSQQDAVQAALLRARRFTTENAAQLTSSVDLTVARQRLDAVIASFTTHAVDQDANNRSAKGETEKLTHELRSLGGSPSLLGTWLSARTIQLGKGAAATTPSTPQTTPIRWYPARLKFATGSSVRGLPSPSTLAGAT